MKLKLRDIADIQQSLGNLIQTKLPARTAHRLAKVAKEISQECNVFNKTREDLIRRLGVINEPKGIIEVPPEKMEEFRREIGELLEDEIEINFEPIPVGMLGDIQMTPADMAMLWFLFEDEEKTAQV